MKTLSQLLKVGSIVIVVLALMSLLLDTIEFMSKIEYRFEGNVPFLMICQTLPNFIQPIILIFFFIALILDKANDRKIMMASGAGILGILLSMIITIFYAFANSLPYEVFSQPMSGSDFFAVVNIIGNLTVLLVLAGFVLIYVFSARKKRMMLPVIVTCSMLLLSRFYPYLIYGLGISLDSEIHHIISVSIGCVLLPLSYAFSMFMYAYDIDNSQPKML